MLRSAQRTAKFAAPESRDDKIRGQTFRYRMVKSGSVPAARRYLRFSAAGTKRTGGRGISVQSAGIRTLRRGWHTRLPAIHRCRLEYRGLRGGRGRALRPDRRGRGMDISSTSTVSIRGSTVPCLQTAPAVPNSMEKTPTHRMSFPGIFCGDTCWSRPSHTRRHCTTNRQSSPCCVDCRPHDPLIPPLADRTSNRFWTGRISAASRHASSRFRRMSQTNHATSMIEVALFSVPIVIYPISTLPVKGILSDPRGPSHRFATDRSVVCSAPQIWPNVERLREQD